MSKNAAYIVSSLCTFLCISVICGVLLYGCSSANDRYYKAQSECVTQGGSWIPTGNGVSYQASCVYGRGK
jgi:hypothetical protein